MPLEYLCRHTPAKFGRTGLILSRYILRSLSYLSGIYAILTTRYRPSYTMANFALWPVYLAHQPESSQAGVGGSKLVIRLLRTMLYYHIRFH